MKNLGILLLLTLPLTITSFSQTILLDTIVSITPNQLKETNLIFLEHQQLQDNIVTYRHLIDEHKLYVEKQKEEITLLNGKIDSYKHLYDVQSNKITDLENTILKKDKYNRNWKIFGFTGFGVGITGLILGWIL